ncbi:MAG TPA: hypothetical protein VKZ53_11125 [Candidatus Angelobacter sp.]|nr:hypothetical protein [Candidatus Angelobacter sp.]
MKSKLNASMKSFTNCRSLLQVSIVLAVVGFTAQAGFAQTASQSTNPALPIITFDLFWEAATPQNFTITADSSGRARYVSRNPTREASEAEQSDDPDYHVEFTLSAASRERIFELAKATGYFQGDFDFKRHAVANTGKKTLSYADPVRNFQTTYNWSENKAIDQLTSLFQGISNTLEHGRKLEFLHRFDRLGLEAELRGMESLAASGNLAEIQAIAPILKLIAGDSAVINLARQRARRLLGS